MKTWIKQHHDIATMDLQVGEIPGEKMWNFDYFNANFPQWISSDSRSAQTATRWWWKGDSEQIGWYIAGYKSRFIPISMFTPAHSATFAKALFDASRHLSVGIHFNKGQAGASKNAIARGRETSINPRVFDAAALIIIAAGSDAKKSAALALKVDAAMAAIQSVLPDNASYSNEADYFEADWQQAFWGDNYEKLRAIKQKYDPSRFFHCHHCVGSEER